MRTHLLGAITLLAAGLSLVSASQGHARVKRIVNGTEVEAPCSWPYVVIVEKRCVETGDIPLRCGGTIVALDRVLTNKQCVMPDFPTNIGCDTVVIRVIAGAHVFADVTEVTRQARYVTHAIDHPDADITMLTLETPLVLDAGHVEEATLTNREHRLNETAKAAGWGSTNVSSPYQFSYHLKEVGLYVRHYEPGLLFYSTSVVNVFQEDSGVLNGDSGGPIVHYPVNDNNCTNGELVAVTNCFFPVGNCGHWRQGRHPEVYYYRSWIVEQIANEHPEPDAAPPGLTVAPLLLIVTMVTTIIGF